MELSRNILEDAKQQAVTENSGRTSLFQRVHRWLGKEQITVDQQALSDNIGKIAIVGDFGYKPSEQLRAGTAMRIARMLKDSSIIKAAEPVDIRMMVPDITREGHKSLDVSMDMLAGSFREIGTATQYVHTEPIVVPIEGRRKQELYAYAKLGKAAVEPVNDSLDKSMVVVANPIFIAQTFQNLSYQHMEAGGIAVLAAVGEKPEGNKFVRLWSGISGD